MPFPSDTDPDTEIFALLDRELERQTTGLQLIASENFTSPAVMRAVGSVLTNKYSEGYPGKRYYGGNAVVDDVEALAIAPRQGAVRGRPRQRAAALRCQRQHVRVPGVVEAGRHGARPQPRPRWPPDPRFAGQRQRHARTTSCLQVTPGDERIDMDQVRDLALEHRPKMIVAGTTSYPRRLDPEPFRAIADEVGALFMFDAAHIAGLIAGGAHPNPVPFADIVTFTTHKTLRGPRGGCILGQAEHAAGDRQGRVPRLAGRPARARDRRQGGGVPRGVARRRSATTPQQIVANASALAEALSQRGLPAGVGRHRQPPDGRRPAPLRCRADRQGGPDRARPRRHHAEQEHDPRRPRAARSSRVACASAPRRSRRRA